MRISVAAVAVTELWQGHRKLLALVLAGASPLLYWHFGSLLQRPHYQYVVFVPLAVWILLRSQVDVIAEQGAKRLMIIPAWALLILSGIGLAFATWVWSPWLAAASTLTATLSILLTFERTAVDRWLPAWVFCWVVVPLPFGLDQTLVVRLRNLTTDMSSEVLDQIGVLHQSYANVIEVPQKPLFIADACSGIQSLYVLLAVALFVAMWARRSSLHTVLLLAGTFGLVLVENVSRIVAVAFALGYKLDLSTGVSHTILGIILFCVSVLLVLSSDQLLLFLLPTRPFAWLDSFFAPPQSTRRTSVSKADKPQAVVENVPRNLSLMTAFVYMFPMMGIAQVLAMPAGAPVPAEFFQADFDLPDIGNDALPQSLGNYQLTNHSVIERVFGDPFGQASQQWEYQDGKSGALISIDYPYTGIHDLCLCYEQIGWKAEKQQMLSQKELSTMTGIADVQGPLAIAFLNREFYGRGLLLFSVSDRAGTTDAMLRLKGEAKATERLVERFSATQSNSVEKPADSVLKPPLIQYQMLVRSAGSFSDEDVTTLIRTYVEVRTQLRHRVIASSANH